MMRLNINYTDFIKSAADPSGFIRDGLPQIIFAGRSNAGKSSLINALMNRNKLARVSETPGKTIYVNYFLIDKKLYLVDLPGYGFAKTSGSRTKDWSH
jgi:GTP-binding protein